MPLTVKIRENELMLTVGHLTIQFFFWMAWYRKKENLCSCLFQTLENPEQLTKKNKRKVNLYCNGNFHINYITLKTLCLFGCSIRLLWLIDWMVCFAWNRSATNFAGEFYVDGGQKIRSINSNLQRPLCIVYI